MSSDLSTESDKPARMIVVVGLPGSGKSTYMSELMSRGSRYSLYDDYQAVAYEDDADPRLSKSYGALVSDLKQGRSVVVSDIRYCIPRELGVFLGAILSAAPNVVLEFRFFENNPEQCRANVLKRNREGRVERELELIDELSAKYAAPTVETIPVHDPGRE